MRRSPGGAAGAIDRRLEGAGYRSVGKARRFIVRGKYGPLRDGEIELARQWGAELAEMFQSERSVEDGSALADDRARSDDGPRG